MQGNVFTECCKDEAIALLEGRAEYKKRVEPDLQRTTSIEETIEAIETIDAIETI